MNPAIMRNGGMNGAMPPPRSFGRDRMIGKTVTVKKGPFKGLIGIVKDATEDQARVELHSKSKIVTIPKELLVVKEWVSLFSFGCSVGALLTPSQSGYWSDYRYLSRRKGCTAHPVCSSAGSRRVAGWSHSYGRTRFLKDPCLGCCCILEK